MFSDMELALSKMARIIDIDSITYIPKEKRDAVLSTWQQIVDKYPNHPATHDIMSELCLKAMEGDRAMTHLEQFCAYTEKGCVRKRKFKGDIVSFFNTCVTSEGTKECEIVHTSSDILSQELNGTYLTNEGHPQNWIGRIVALDGDQAVVAITFVGGTSKAENEYQQNEYDKGKEYRFSLSQVDLLTKISPEAKIDGYE